MWLDNPYEKKGEKSGYIPSKEVSELTKQVQRDYSFGHGILTRPWIELNQRSVIDDLNRGNLMFNDFVDTTVEDPAEAWKWRGTRSMARNKGIAMHAQLTGNFILPLFIAQNENDETDRQFAEVMRDIIEWMAEPNNSNYQQSFLDIVFGMMDSPVVYLGAEFARITQLVKERDAQGSFQRKEVIDEVLSGFQAPVYDATQVLITNAYERNIQRQRAIIKKRFVDKEELRAKYEKHPYWQFVKAGWKTVYNTKDGLFYDHYDMQHPLLVEEVTWMNRRNDMEVPFLGGIYMGDPNNVDFNPIKHRDNRGNPKYNVIPFGYSRIGRHFFYYKSMMNVVGWNNSLYDAMTEIVMNRSILEVDQPLVVSGSDKVDSEIVFPKAVLAFEDPQTKVTPMLPKADLGAGFSALADTEKAISNSTIDAVSSGQLPAGSARGMAYVMATVQANAKKIIDEVGKSLKLSLDQYGDLMKDIAINHVTIPEVDEIEGGQMRLKYRQFLLPNKQVGGKTVHKKIVFDQSLIGLEMTSDEKTQASLQLLEASGWPDSKHALIHINPELFARFKYMASTDIEELHAHNQEYWQPVLTNLYQLLANDPLADHEGLLRRLLRSYFNAEGDELVKSAPTPNQGGGAPNAEAVSKLLPQKGPQPGTPGGGKLPLGGPQLGQMAQARALSNTLPPAQGR